MMLIKNTGESVTVSGTKSINFYKADKYEQPE